MILLKSHPGWHGIRWPRRDPRLHHAKSLDEVAEAAGRGGVDRIVIEERIAGGDFLRLLSHVPRDIEIIWIEGPGEAYVSTRQRELFTIDSADVERYALENVVPDLTGKRVRVLIAEDERKTREFLVSVIDSLGCQSLVAATGLEAVKVVQEHRPHVLLIDGLLPELHGFEVARVVRALDQGYQPRIAIVTAIYKDARYQSEAREKYGVNHYLVKPVTREQVASVVFGA